MKDTLNKLDIKKWLKDIVIYCLIPVGIVFLSTLQTGSLEQAVGASKVALIAAAINLLRKYSAGTDQPINQDLK